MRRPGVAAVAMIGGLAAELAPSVTAIGPVRRRLAPRHAGTGPGPHIALTFDDGPDPASTPRFLDLLAHHERRATFFVLAEQARAEPRLVRRMADEGHELALHGWTHRCTLTFPPTHLARRLGEGKNAVEDITGSPVRWYRPPYGVGSLESLAACRVLGLTPVLWTAWGRDWERSATPSSIVSTLLRTLRPGGTILLHDTDLHARGDWRGTYHATADLLSGPLHAEDVGPLRDHWASPLLPEATASVVRPSSPPSPPPSAPRSPGTRDPGDPEPDGPVVPGRRDVGPCRRRADRKMLVGENRSGEESP